MAQGDYLGIVMQSDIGAQGQNGVASQTDMDNVQDELQLTTQTANTAKDDIDAIMTSKTIGPTALAGFSDGVDGAILGKCVVNIEPAQSGSGDPSPTNVRPISGWTGAKVTRANSNIQQIAIEPVQSGSGDPSPTNVRPISPGLSLLRDDGTTLDIYGGTLDVRTGVLTVTHAYLQLTSARALYTYNDMHGVVVSDQILQTGNRQIGICSHEANVGTFTNRHCLWVGAQSTLIYWVGILDVLGISTVEEFNEWIATQTVQLAYELATPVTYQLTPTEISRVCAALGVNASQYQISFGEAGTVYGGTLDVGTGVLTVDTFYGHVDKISYYWSKQGDYIGFYTYLKPGSGAYSLNWPDPKGNLLFCNEFPIRGESGQIGATFNSAYSYISFRILYSDLGISDTATESEIVSAANSWLVSHPLYVVYPIATPITYQLTPVQIRTLLGLNNIYADCGEVTVQYRGDVPNLYENVAVITEQKNKFYCPPLYQYDGEDLTVKFASEIAQYSDVCAWLKARLAAKDISGIFVKDYFRFTTSNGYTFTARIADINHDLGYGDTEVTKYHIDFICDEVWPDNHVWNKVNYNNGIAEEPSPWCASDLYHFLNSLSGNVPNGTGADPATVAVDYTSTGVFDKLPAWLRNAIVERRSLEPTRYTAGNLLTDDAGQAWKNIGKLWVPSEIEYYGFVALGTRKGYSIGEGHMYPLMRDGKMRIKRKPNDRRNALWLRRAHSGSSTGVANCLASGDASDNACTSTGVASPVCFRIMAN